MKPQLKRFRRLRYIPALPEQDREMLMKKLQMELSISTVVWKIDLDIIASV